PASAKSAKLMRTSPSTTASRSPKRSAALCTSRGVVPHSRSPRMAATVAERPDGPSGSVRGMGEVEEAFRHYWRVGAVGGDWEAWADLFTDDAIYREHILGHMRGRDEIKRWITSIMATVPELYTFYEWHTVDGDRVIFYMQNRRDNPEPGGAPIDFPGVTVLEIGR